jgi:hypothetical protein
MLRAWVSTNGLFDKAADQGIRLHAIVPEKHCEIGPCHRTKPACPGVRGAVLWRVSIEVGGVDNAYIDQSARSRDDGLGFRHTSRLLSVRENLLEFCRLCRRKVTLVIP